MGHKLAGSLVALMEDEIKSGFKTRSIDRAWQQFCSYAAMKMDTTSGAFTGSEVTGNCRLRWYDRLMRNPLSAPAEAEKFTRDLHVALRGDHTGLDQALRIAREKMDHGSREARRFAPVTSPEAALDAVGEALNGAQAGYAAALAPLTRSELNELVRSLYPVLTGSARQGHTLDDRGTGRRLCDLMEKMDRAGLYAAADALIPLADPDLLKQLASLPDDGEVRVEGVTGKVVRQVVMPGGAIVVGGKEKNVYDLDKMTGVTAIIDLGGDDEYREGAVSFERPVLITIDLGGDDRYEATRPGVQGGAVLGVGMLIDVAGNDVYRAKDVAQGSCLAGVGILIDYQGDDQYLAIRRAQGQALGGLGLLIDRAGRDRYHAAMWAQGYGGPLGFAVLDDLAGEDHYYAGGLYLDSYPETPGYEGWSQGIGSGLRQVASGGIGVILDGGGDDVYEFDYISHGGGYWCGLGFARDFGGNDRRYGGTRTAYSGGARGEPMFQRFSNGFGCHYALGFLFDDAGDDSYGGTIMGLGFAWDLSVGFLCDFGGNDRYEATGGGTQGNGAQAGLGVIFDYTGNDTYLGQGQGFASPGISYHPLPQCGGNFSFVIDYGGKDTYGCGAQDNTYNRRGSDNGFLIDRPLPEEAASPQTTARPKDGTRAGT
ncbi:MAG: hypothetical protein NUV77_18915 [Thermoguttaceae bacterium]|nr:hypothetical protein [Thermoguttaceae bacterium]